MDPSQHAYVCPLCGAGLRCAPHCKLRCENCGYIEDCSDLFDGSAAVDRRSADLAGASDAWPDSPALPSMPAEWFPRVN